MVTIYWLTINKNHINRLNSGNFEILNQYELYSNLWIDATSIDLSNFIDSFQVNLKLSNLSRSFRTSFFPISTPIFQLHDLSNWIFQLNVSQINTVGDFEIISKSE